jgi:hypothetical protein
MSTSLSKPVLKPETIGLGALVRPQLIPANDCLA